MAQAGKDAQFRLDNALGALVDITSYLTEIGHPQEPEQLETTALGSQEKSYVSGFIGASVTLNGRFDAATGAIYDVLATGVGASGSNNQRTYQFFPYGSTGFAPAVLQPRYSGELVILTFEVTTGAADIVGFTCTCRVVSAVTRAVA